MFTSKKTTLETATSVKTRKSTNGFLSKALENSAVTASENGAKKYSKTDDEFVTQFGQVGTYKKPRTFEAISNDMLKLWGTDKVKTIMFALYLRMITRVTDVFGVKTKETQRGAQMRHEGIMRMIWLHVTDAKAFWKNVTIMISVGSWKDIFTMLQYDLVYNGWEDRKLDWNKFGKLILAGLNDDTQSNLVKKYLPQIKTKSACKTVEAQADNMIGKWLCSLLFDTKENKVQSYKEYRKLKTSGNAHDWQKLISQKKMDLLDFNKIHGRALNLLVRSKFLSNQGLEVKYAEWIGDENTTVKYTGFVHELFQKLPTSYTYLDANTRDTINKQFATLVEKGGASEKETKLIVVRDTSGSMGSTATGTNMSCYNVAKALALYFSEFLTGQFENAWIEFNSSAKMHTWNGESPLEKWYNDGSGYVGGTNFQSVIDLFVKLKKEGVAESDFPTGILCISDSEFNPSQLGQTNVETALNKLRAHGFSNEYVNKFVIVLWNLQSYGRGNKFETHNTQVPNVYYFSGYEPSIISFLTDDIKNAYELFNAAMDQETLRMVNI